MTIIEIQKIASDLLPFFQKHTVKSSKKGRPQMNLLNVLTAILFVMRSGCQWRFIPSSLGKVSTIHGTYMRWARNGLLKSVFSDLKLIYHKKHGEKNWLVLDTSSKKAPFAEFAGKSPVDRSKNGIKHIAIVDRNGVPMAIEVAAGNVHDSQLVDSVIEQLGSADFLRILAADSAYDDEKIRQNVKKKASFYLLLLIQEGQKTREFQKFYIVGL